jgi:hypothetical protein
MTIGRNRGNLEFMSQTKSTKTLGFSGLLILFGMKTKWVCESYNPAFVCNQNW